MCQASLKWGNYFFQISLMFQFIFPPVLESHRPYEFTSSHLLEPFQRERVLEHIRAKRWNWKLKVGKGKNLWLPSDTCIHWTTVKYLYSVLQREEMIEKCDWKFNALKTYLKNNHNPFKCLQNRNVQNLEFFHLPVSAIFFPSCVKHGRVQGTFPSEYITSPCVFTGEDWVAESWNASHRKYLWHRGFKWPQLPKSHINALTKISPFFTILFLFLSSLFCKHIFVWCNEVSGLSLLQAPQNFTLYVLFFVLFCCFTVPLYITCMLSC